MRRNITYFKDPKTGLLMSKVGSEIAVAIIDLIKTIPNNPDPNSGGYWSLKEQYPIHKQDTTKVREKWYNALIPISRNKIKQHYLDCWINYHRDFWGLKILKEGKND